MRLFTLRWLAAGLLANVPFAAWSQTNGVPVLLELFTSEGCSSCPPADALLQKMDHDQPVAGAALIVLSEHVDYWNNGGWRDPFSSHSLTERQEEYAQRLGAAEIFTPQLVVDGVRQLVGSNWQAARQAITAAAAQAKVPVTLTLQPERNGSRMQVTTAAVPAKAEVYLAVARDHTAKHIGGGENAGRDLAHVAVAESVRRIGSVRSGEEFLKEIELRPAQAGEGKSRVIVFLQDARSHRILGVAQTVR